MVGDENMANRVLVMGHRQPDGDCISSALVMAKYYINGGIPAKLFLPERLSPNLSWMPKEASVQTIELTEALEWLPDALVVMDCAPTEVRTGFPIEKYMEANKFTQIENIDHHADRLKEAPPPYVDRIRKTIKDDASSTAEILIRDGGIDGNFYHALLYVGLATDTLFFRVGKVKQAMQAASKLIIDDDTITRYRDNLDIRLTADQLVYLFDCHVLWTYPDEVNNKVVIIEMPVSDGELNVTLLNLIRGFDFAAIIQGDGRVSLRTRLKSVDLSVFAKQWHGGGHPQACGCHIDENEKEKFASAFRDFASISSGEGEK
jgi:nanoRNase/pAp phosphatase (c-di-AMP/oligoRNAs hydrolase)